MDAEASNLLPSSPMATSGINGQKRDSEEADESVSSTTTTGPGYHSQQIRSIMLMGVPIIALVIDGHERLCLAQISNTLLKKFSYNEIHNRRVALGITCLQCTPVQLEILRRAGAMPVSSRRCGMITFREADRLCKSFLVDQPPPRLPEDFAFEVEHRCAWGCKGRFIPARYNSSRAKCVQCIQCALFFSPNKFIFHSHRNDQDSKYIQPDAANFNAWRRHLYLSDTKAQDVVHAWEDVKAMFNGGSRKRIHSVSPPIMKEDNISVGLKLNTNSTMSHMQTGFSKPQEDTTPVVKKPALPQPAKTISTSVTPVQTTAPQPTFNRTPFGNYEYPISPFGLTAPQFCWPYAPNPSAFSSIFQHPSLLAGAIGAHGFYGALDPTGTTAHQTLLRNTELFNRQNNNISKDDDTTAAQIYNIKHEQPVDEKEEKSSGRPVTLTDLPKEKLQELLLAEMETRKKLEVDLKKYKDSSD